MVTKHSEAVRPLLSVLKALQEEPDDQQRFARLLNELDRLGINQGAVLNYAPYLKVVLSEQLVGSRGRSLATGY